MKLTSGRDFPAFTSEYRGMIKTAYWTLKVLTLPVPRRIIDVLRSYPAGRSVTHIYIALRMDQSQCSQHLRLLRKYDLVTCERNGKQIIYRVNEERIERIALALNRFNGIESKEYNWEQTLV